MNSRPWVIARKELLQLRRDRLTLAMMVALPVMQLLLFGYAINTDVRHIPTIVYDQDRTAASRDLVPRPRGNRFLRCRRERPRLLGNRKRSSKQQMLELLS